MKSRLFVAVMLVLVLSVVVMAGEPGQTRDAAGSEPRPAQPGTAGTGLESPRALADGSSERAEEMMPDPAQSYNATLRIPAAALKPRVSDVDWAAGGGGGCTYATAGNQWTWWAAPLYLPNGSTLHYFRMYYNDQNTTYDCEAWLTVYDLYGDIVTEWGIGSEGTGKNYDTTPELDHVIDYDLYNYVIHWRPKVIGTSMQVCGFRVYYEYTWGVSFLPSVMKED